MVVFTRKPTPYLCLPHEHHLSLERTQCASSFLEHASPCDVLEASELGMQLSSELIKLAYDFEETNAIMFVDRRKSWANLGEENT